MEVVKVISGRGRWVESKEVERNGRRGPGLSHSLWYPRIYHSQYKVSKDPGSRTADVFGG